jgi:isoleucyl-tRNA synthetase
VVRRYKNEEGGELAVTMSHIPSANLMDQWIQAAAAGLLQFVNAEMKAYRLYTVVPRLLKFMDDLTNWYLNPKP